MAETLRSVVVHADAADLLAQWDGFGRFCRETLGTEPLVLLGAFGLQRADVAAEVTAAAGDAVPDEAATATRAQRWATSWHRRFGTATAG